LAGEGHRTRTRAHVAEGITVTGQGVAAVSVREARVLNDTVGLAREHVDRAGRRRTELVTVGVVAHRVVLGVVPESGDGVAIEIAHHLTGGAEGARAAARALAGKGREAVHLATVVSRLLSAVAVALVGGVGLGAVETERIGSARAVERIEVRVVVEQRRVR